MPALFCSIRLMRSTPALEQRACRPALAPAPRELPRFLGQVG
jgi:hypothetical protein